MEKYNSSFRDSKRSLMKAELYFLYPVWLKEHADSGANNSIYLFIMKNDSVIFYLGDIKRNHSLMFFESSKFRISIANMRLIFVFTIENLYLIKNEILR